MAVGSHFGGALALLAFGKSGGGGCNSLVRALISHPVELSSFIRALEVATSGSHCPSALESGKTDPPNYKFLSAGFRLLCSRDFVAGLGGKSLTLA